MATIPRPYHPSEHIIAFLDPTIPRPYHLITWLSIALWTHKHHCDLQGEWPKRCCDFGSLVWERIIVTSDRPIPKSFLKSWHQWERRPMIPWQRGIRKLILDVVSVWAWWCSVLWFVSATIFWWDLAPEIAGLRCRWRSMASTSRLPCPTLWK